MILPRIKLNGHRDDWLRQDTLLPCSVYKAIKSASLVSGQTKRRRQGKIVESSRLLLDPSVDGKSEECKDGQVLGGQPLEYIVADAVGGSSG